MLCYVYQLADPNTRVIFSVGKGIGKWDDQ